MKDKFSTYSAGLNAPASEAEAITPRRPNRPALGDPRALHRNHRQREGDHALGRNGRSHAASGGIMYPLRVRRVLATGTDATNLVALR